MMFPGEQVEIKPDFTGGSGDDGAIRGTRGGGGGSGDDNDGDKSDEGSDDANAERNKALLMSQKFALGFVALVGLGGLMGYLKSGSHKSLASGGLSALLLYYVYTELPKRPVFASSVGLGLSAALLVMMGSRFKKHLCGTYPFKKTPHETHCKLCYCYVCDISAPCKKWTRGCKDPNLKHCEATPDIPLWKRRRDRRKQRNEGY
ncbi:uncharacterized protein LOC141632627 [Silene latifolia]|uniref:uncharacterized protein LOC141632627 n=1 Tax=Silene latifolia TaxID=37657 RepID=UPI003D770353